MEQLQQDLNWLPRPTRRSKLGRQAVAACYRLPEAYVRALRKYVKIQTKLEGRPVTQSTALMTLSLSASPGLKLLYDRELAKKRPRR